MDDLITRHADLIEVFSKNYAIPARSNPDEWASRFVRLDSDIAEFYDPEAAPYFVQPFRRMFNNAYKEICIVAPPGTGKTALFEAAICYIAHQDPGDTLVCSKNDDLLRQWLDSRLNPILARCEPLRDYLPKSTGRQKTLTLLRHMFIAARAANEASMQQISVRYALGDEVWQWNAGLIGYLRKRLHDRWNGRTVLVSQAGYAGSEWESVCAEGNQYEYHWICKRCGVRQPFNFDSNLKWQGDADKKAISWETVRATVHLECPHCGESYADTAENRRTLSATATWEMVKSGEDSTHETYWIPALANFRVAWFTLVREFIAARRAWKLGDRDPWFQFVTQRKSEFWKDEHGTDEGELKTALYSWKSFSTGQKVEKEVVRFMTIDRQLAHYWVAVRAWCEGGASRLLLYTMAMAEEDLRSIQLGYGVEDRFVFQDSAYDSPDVYKQCAKFGWFALLGTNENSYQHPKKDVRGRANGVEHKMYSRIREIAVSSTQRCRLIMLATERIKDITGYLRDGKSFLWEVPGDVPELYTKQINGESRRETIEPKTKRSVFRWVQIKANHAWDCECYQTAAALIVGVLQV